MCDFGEPHPLPDPQLNLICKVTGFFPGTSARVPWTGPGGDIMKARGGARWHPRNVQLHKTPAALCFPDTTVSTQSRARQVRKAKNFNFQHELYGREHNAM